MKKQLQFYYYNTASSEDIKWLYSEEFMPCDILLSEFQTINQHFIEHYEIHELKEHQWEDPYEHTLPVSTYRQRMEQRWVSLLKFITDFSTMICAPFVENNLISCMVETKQNYDNWSDDNIVYLLECMGKAAKMLYCASRDWLICRHVLAPATYYPLAQYYVGCMEYITWMVASFSQKNTGNFVDLTTKLRSLFVINNSHFNQQKTMKPLSKRKQEELIKKINATYQPGDKIKVKQDCGEILEWTMREPASMMGGHTAVIWVEEHRSCYSAERVKIGKAK